MRRMPFARVPLVLAFAAGAAPLACSHAAPPPPPQFYAHASDLLIPKPTTPLDDSPQPPVAKREPHETTLHGKKLVDDYYWLRNKGMLDVEAYLTAENDYTRAVTKPTEPLQKLLYDEMVARVKEDDTTPPFKKDGWLYYRRYEKGKQYPLHCRRRGNEAESVVLDPNEIGKTESFVDVPTLVVSDDGATMAYLVDTVGFRQFTLKVKDLRTGALGSEAIPRVDEVAWAKDNRTLFYVTEDAQTKRPNKLFRHAVGTDASKDTLVYEEKDEMFDLYLERTRSKAFLVVTSESRTTTEVRVVDAAKPASLPRVIAPREHEHEYYVDHRGDAFYIRTNEHGAKNFKVVTAPVADPRREKWKEIVAQRPDAYIEEHAVLANYMVLLTRQDALSQLEVVDLKTNRVQRVPQPEPVFEIAFDRNEELGASKFRVRYQSLKTPVQWVDYDLKTKKREVVKKTEVLGYDPNAYETKRVQVPARDGTMIPVSLVYKKGTSPDGTHPAHLYAYGSYGYAAPLSFSSERVSLLDRGFVYAHAHVRGGGDLGKSWHDAGKMTTKMNTFTDFIDVADWLKKEGWAKKDALVVSGASAGGLLMGAVTNMRPDLFRVVLAYVPFVDVVNTMLDETLPLTVNEFEEWGNPKVKKEYDYISQYSPYDNVTAKAYPTMLVRTSYHDSQVMYWEPVKWVAKLRAMKTDKNPLLLKINMEPAGHAGHAGRYDKIRDTAFDYAFILSQLESAAGR